MLRALLARLRMWLNLLIGIVGPRGEQTRPGLRAADPQGRAEVPLLRHVTHMGRAVGPRSPGAPALLGTLWVGHCPSGQG
jgi:hypothetical protein